MSFCKMVKGVKTCADCGSESTQLCDYPLVGGPVRESATCGRPMCDRHAVRVGDRDYCQIHAKLVFEHRRHGWKF
jgi:hypothetical protein